MIRLLPALAVLLLCCGAVLILSKDVQPATTSKVDSQQVQRELRDILSNPEYNRSDAPAGVELWIQRAWRSLSDALSRFVTWLRHRLGFRLGAGVGDLVSFIFAWAVVAAFLVLLGLVIRKLGGIARGASKAPDEDRATYGLPSAAPLLQEAARLAELGDFRGAFRCAYLACISHLDESGALRFERSRTNWEYMRELVSGGHDAPAGRLRPVTQVFDRKIYGREAVDRQDYLDAVSAYRSIAGEVTA